MNFGEALEALKSGKKVSRVGWNGKGMFLYLTKGSVVQYDNLREDTKRYVTEESTGKPIAAIINAHIDMRTAGGEIAIGWLVSQADMLSNDWQIAK